MLKPLRQNRYGFDAKLDALMAEYDPRPSRSRREHTLDKLRKALPWPETFPQLASGGGGGVSGTCDEEYFHGEAGLSGDHAGAIEDGRGEGGRHEDDVSDDGYYADDFAGDDRRDIIAEARWGEGGEQLPSRARGQTESNDAKAVADGAGAGGGRGVVGCPSSGNKYGNGDGDTSSALGRCNAREHSTGNGVEENTGKSVNAADADVEAEEVNPGSPPEPRVPPGGDGDGDDDKLAVTADTAMENDQVAVRDNQGRAGAAATGGPTKRPATGQRKAR